MSSLVILSASVFKFLWGKQTDRQTNASENRTPANAMGGG